MEYGVSEFTVNATPVGQPQAITMRDADQWNVMFGGGRESLAGVKVTHKSVMGCPAFWRGVNLIANGVCLPLDVFKRTENNGREVDDKHYAQTLVSLDASPVVDACVLRETLQSHALIFGNGIAYIERDRRQRPVEIWALNPQNIVTRYMDGELWYCTTIGSEQRKFPSRDVIHIKGLTHNGIDGYSALDLFNEAMGLGIAAQQFGSRFFGQGANMGGLLMVPGNFSEEKIRNTLGAWKTMSEGMKNSHKVALLQDGVKFQPTQVTPEQGQFIETRAHEIREVSSILGVPPHMLGDSTRTSDNSLESESESLLTHTWGPWLRRWERECGRKLLTVRERKNRTHFIEFNREAVVQMLFRDKVDGIYRQVEMGILTVNEGRQKLNEPSVGPDGDKRYHPANWVAIGEESEPMSTAVPPEPLPADDEQQTQTASVLRAMIETSVTDSLAIEARRVIDASSKPDGFCGWVDNFYEGWTVKAVAGLSSPAAIAEKTAYAEESKRQLLDVAGASTPATLSGNVAELVSTWDDRAVTLTANLMESI